MASAVRWGDMERWIMCRTTHGRVRTSRLRQPRANLVVALLVRAATAATFAVSATKEESDCGRVTVEADGAADAHVETRADHHIEPVCAAHTRTIQCTHATVKSVLHTFMQS
jgi:hypothetical protein